MRSRTAVTIPSLPRSEVGPGPLDAVVTGRRSALAYLALVVLPIVGLLLVLQLGSGLPRPDTAPAPAARSIVPAELVVLRLPVFLTQIIVIIGVARLTGLALRRFGQPQVVGEMLAGLLLGPSLLGLVAPGAYGWLFPPGTTRFLNALSQIGLVLFMFLVGLELQLRELAARGRQAVLVSHAGIAVPMFLGALLGLALYRDFGTRVTDFAPFALFMACALSITALPVLARILEEHALARTAFGALVMASAAVADVTAWLVMAVVVALARDGTAPTAGSLAGSLLGLVLYLAAMLLVIRPVLRRFWAWHCARFAAGPPPLGPNVLTALLVFVLGSAVATEWLEVHALFGAFVAGAVMPEDPELRAALRARFIDLLQVLLVPLFFAYAGVRTDLGALTTRADWLVCALVIATAMAGKLGGTALASRAAGIPWRESTAVGVLMNARGLMELVLLTLGLEIGVITPKLFAIMVLMAIATTLMTVPLLALVRLRTGPATA